MTARPRQEDTLDFEQWLDRQQDRKDVVGALAIGIAEYGPEALDLSKRRVRDALRRAYDEYEAEPPSVVGSRR